MCRVHACVSVSFTAIRYLRIAPSSSELNSCEGEGPPFSHAWQHIWLANLFFCLCSPGRRGDSGTLETIRTTAILYLRLVWPWMQPSFVLIWNCNCRWAQAKCTYSAFNQFSGLQDKCLIQMSELWYAESVHLIKDWISIGLVSPFVCRVMLTEVGHGDIGVPHHFFRNFPEQFSKKIVVLSCKFKFWSINLVKICKSATFFPHPREI